MPLALYRIRLDAGARHLIDVVIVWTIAGSGFEPVFWEIPASLLLIGGAFRLALMLPSLAVGKRLVQLGGRTRSDTAFR